MEVIKFLISLAIFGAGCAFAYYKGYENGATAMCLYTTLYCKGKEDEE